MSIEVDDNEPEEVKGLLDWSSIYYQPEPLGLEVVAEMEYSSGGYEFDTRVVWRQVSTGNLYTARDSGCSCPTPFEVFQSIEDLEQVDINELIHEVDTKISGHEAAHNQQSKATEGKAFLQKVVDAMGLRAKIV